MAVIGDFGGTSNSSFSINGKVTLFQGEEIPDDLMGNNGDVYFKSEGLIYVKRNGTWLASSHPEDLKWIPDPRNHQNTLLYSNGENYANTKITYNTTPDDPHQMELYKEPNADTGTTSMIVPNIGWINKSDKNNLLHKTDDEVKKGRLTLERSDMPLLIRNPNQNRDNQGSNEIMNELAFVDKNNKNISTITSILNSAKYKNIYNTTSELRLRTYNKYYTGFDANNDPLDLAQIRLVLGRKNNQNIAFATAPTPLDNASNDEIITAEWFNVKYGILTNLMDELRNYVDEQISILRNYVNTTVENLKNSVLGMPNYGARYRIPSNNWTVPENGWVCLYGDHNNGGHLYINEVLVIGSDKGSSKEIAGHQLLCPVSKNSIIRWDGTGYAYFFPNV